MERVAVDADQPDPTTVALAAARLRAGLLVIYPTDTLYALGGTALERAVGSAVRAAKGRDDAKPLPVIASGLDQARSLCAEWTPTADRLAERFWPGPLTLVLRASARLPAPVTAGTGTVAVRVPGRALPRLLCDAAGPLISTSANRAGFPAPLTCDEAVRAVGSAVALALDAGPGRPAASTIVDLTDAPRLLRAGPVSWADVLEILG